MATTIEKRMCRLVYLTRCSKNISQVELSEMMDVSQGTVSRIERGLLEPTAKFWLTFCDRFKIAPSIVLQNDAYSKLEKKLEKAL